MEVKTVAVQIRCPYCKQVLYINEKEFDIETRCSHCNRAFIWSNILEKERWKEENRKRWQETQKQQEQVHLLEDAKRPREIPEDHERKTSDASSPSRFRLGLLGVLGVVAAAAAVIAIIAFAFYLREKSETALYVSAEDLYGAYKEDQTVADSRYTGRILQVIGEVADIGKDAEGDAYVCLAGSDRESTVQCFFPKSEEDALERLSKGDTIRVVGECKGMKSWNVLLHNCRGIEKSPPVR
jgi:DNA-directed RNA polymerase subunit M/transcription elongation factor TFIIS